MSVVTTAAQRSRVQNVCTDGLTALWLPPLAGIWVAGVCWLLAGLLMGWPVLAAAYQWLHRLLCPRLFPKFTPTMGHVKVGTADVSVAIALCCWPYLLLCLLHATCMTCHVACAALVTCLVASPLVQVTLQLLGSTPVACRLSPLVGAPSYRTTFAAWKTSITCQWWTPGPRRPFAKAPLLSTTRSPTQHPSPNSLPTPAEYVVLTTI